MTLQSPSTAQTGLNPVLQRLSAFGPLSAELKRRVEALGRRSEVVAGRALLQAEGESVAKPRLILSGWAFRQRLLPDGRRQIFSLLLPGDALGLAIRPRSLDTTAAVALTRMITVDASDLLGASALAECAELSGLLHRATQFEEALLLDHIVRLGRQTAYERVAHLLLELNDRLQTVGLSDGRVFEAPLTQEVMADALGLSVVHINRTLQQLRRERMIVFEAGRVDLLSPDLLAAAADYSPWRPAGS